MRLLFVVPYVPNLIRVRPYNLIRHLAARDHQVTVLTLWSNQQERADAEALKEHCHRVVALPLPRWRSLWNCLRALPTRVPLQAVYCWQPALARAVNEVMSQQVNESPGYRESGASRSRVGSSTRCPFDVVHVEHLRAARYGLAMRNSQFAIPIVYDSVDCISYLFEQAAQNSRSLKGRLMTRLELERTRRYEAYLVRQFDRVLVTSPVDREALVRLHQETRRQGDGLPLSPSPPHPVSPSPPLPITVLPNGVDLDYFTPSDEPRCCGRSPDRATIVFTGKMSYHANVTAVLHLVQDIMPHVWAQRPDVNVWIVGKDPPREIRVLSQLSVNSAHPCSVTGTVPEVRPYLRRATLAAAPVPYGAGVQNKVLEAMACGTPVVASPQATAALAVQPGRDLVVAEGAEAFARAVLALLDDPARRAQLAQAGRAYVEAHHDWDAVVAALETVYRDTIDSSAVAGLRPSHSRVSDRATPATRR